jgi:hypothetical protein
MIRIEKVRSCIGWLFILSRLAMFALIALFRVIEFYDDATVRCAVCGSLLLTVHKTKEIFTYFRKNRHRKGAREEINKNYSYSSFLPMIFFIAVTLILLAWQGIRPFSLSNFSLFLAISEMSFVAYVTPIVNDLFNLVNNDEAPPESTISF